jgi:hypothetical protein
LLRGNSNEGHPLVGWLEPNDLRALDGTARLIATVALALAALGLLLLFGSRRRRAKKPKRAREQLPRHAFNDSNHMASILWLDLVGDPDSVSYDLKINKKVELTPHRQTA